jgi:lipopolysaccharide/colanic/teichoic acid biosynthesis glycosyltransferase
MGVHARPSSDVTVRASPAAYARPRSARNSLLLAIASALLGMILLPIVYAYLIYGNDFLRLVSGEELMHLIANGAANAVVMGGAVRLSGRLDRKLASILTRTLLVHGALAFVILVGRQFYSNQTMLMSAVASAVIGAAVMYVHHRAQRPRAALLGSWHPLAESIQIPCDHIASPAVDTRRYEVLLTSGPVTDVEPEWSRILTGAMLSGQSVRHLAEFVEEQNGLVSIEHFDIEHLPDGGLVSYRTRKRLLDLGLVLILLPVALPILAAGMLVTLIAMGRPVFFVQTRTGLGGKSFRMYKLRTMRQLSAADAPKATVKGDTRVTPLGKWMRRFRVDELPQLWNVIRGEMSIIGPRPEWDLLADQYGKELPAYTYRHLVRPGVTGWAQVKGGYASNLAETRVKVGYDLFYIKNLSFALDVQILVRTVWTLVSGGGAR